MLRWVKLTTFVINPSLFSPGPLLSHQAQLVQLPHHTLHVWHVGEIVRVHAHHSRPSAPRPTLAVLLFLGFGLGGDLGSAAELTGRGGVGHGAPDGIHVLWHGEQHPFSACDAALLRRGQDAVCGRFTHRCQLTGEKALRSPLERDFLFCHGRAAFIQQLRAVFHQASEILLQRSCVAIRVRDPYPGSRGGRQGRGGRKPGQEFRDRFRELAAAGIAFMRVVERFGM